MKNKYLILLIIFTVFCFGCAPRWESVCRHKAVMAALTAGETHETRIMVGKTKCGTHAQAQVKIDGEWKYLCSGGDWVTVCEQEVFIPNKAWSVKEFIEVLKTHKMISKE